ncbi:MAG: hypothetical protein RRA92_07660 [Gemmatimonadota bacterium]|nr:hypothetical protein [Gemmatimonadota bacterium]
MSLPPLAGHEALRERLARAATEGRLPQSLLFHGPPGGGKERLALWLAALLACGDADAGARPCGRCRACRLADGLQHPDIHWFFPVPAPKGGLSPEKRREKLEETRRDIVARVREAPLVPRPSDPSDALYLPVVNEIRARAALRPAMGSGSAFVVADADRMVPQESSPEAANAFLKLLEEPPPDTVFLLTSSRPGLLLPTIRSRVLAVRVPHPPVEDAARFLAAHAGLEPERARALARQFGGAIGLALREAADEESGEEREAARGLLRAALRGDRADLWAAAASFGPSGARGPFSRVLEALEMLLRDCLAVASGAPGAVLDPDLRAAAAGRGGGLAAIPPEAWLDAADRVEEARDRASGNLNPQAIAAALLAELARGLRPGTAERPAADGGTPGP